MNTKTILRLILLIPVIAGLHLDSAYGQEYVIDKPAGKVTVPLNSGPTVKWTLQYSPQDTNSPMTPDELMKSNRAIIDATVPGNVELDLLNAGKISDPMTGNSVYALREYETYQCLILHP